MSLSRKDFVICSAVLPRIEACPGSAVYVFEGGRPKPNYGQWYGIFAHRFLEYAKTRGRDAALAYIDTKKFPNLHKTCRLIDVDAIPDGDTEVSLAHNPFTDQGWRLPPRVLIASLKWQEEQFGKADLLVHSGRKRTLIVDYKCGEGSSRPEDSTQLMGLQASVRAETGEEVIDIALVNVPSSGILQWKVASIDSIDHSRYVLRTRAVHLRVVEDRRRADQGHEPDFVRGEHCSWCDLRPVCPAHR